MKQKYFFGSLIGVILTLFIFVTGNSTVRADTKNIQVVSSVDFYGEAAEKCWVSMVRLNRSLRTLMLIHMIMNQVPKLLQKFPRLI